jgi:hypothetical protein
LLAPFDSEGLCQFFLASCKGILDNSLGIIAGCIGNIRWAVAPLGLETAASSYSFGENFGGIFGEPLLV